LPWVRISLENVAPIGDLEVSGRRASLITKRAASETAIGGAVPPQRSERLLMLLKDI